MTFRLWTLLAGTSLALLVAAGVVAAVALFPRPHDVRNDGELKAVIIDQLSLYTPNEDFVQQTTTELEQSGYNVDYFGGHDVTVDLYRELPSLHYDLVIIRGHSGVSRRINSETGEMSETEYVSLSTGEPYYRYLHEEEQSKGLLGWSVVEEGQPPVFGFGYEFVNRAMEGNFGGATIIMMGCDGLRTRETAEAFVDRGASAFVSWSKPVSTYQTDRTTRLLVERLVNDGADIESVVKATANEVGPDPWYGGELRILQ